MGEAGLLELELKEDTFGNVFQSYKLIKDSCTVLIDHEINTLTEKFATLTWEAEETFKAFKTKFVAAKSKLLAANVIVPTPIIRLNLLRIIKERFPDYYATYNAQKSILIPDLLNVIEGLQTESETALTKSESTGKAIFAALPDFRKRPTPPGRKPNIPFRASGSSPKVGISPHPGWCAICGKRDPSHPFRNCDQYETWKRNGRVKHIDPLGHSTPVKAMAVLDEELSQDYTFMCLDFSHSNPSSPFLQEASTPLRQNSEMQLTHSEVHHKVSPALHSLRPFLLSDHIVNLSRSSPSLWNEQSQLSISTTQPCPLMPPASRSFVHPEFLATLGNRHDLDHLVQPALTSTEPIFTLLVPDDPTANLSQSRPSSTTLHNTVLLDSACGLNVCFQSELLRDFSPDHAPRTVRCANGATLTTAGTGYLLGFLFHYVPGLTANLLSVGTLADNGFTTTFGRDAKIKLMSTGKVTHTCPMLNFLYGIKLTSPSAPTVALALTPGGDDDSGSTRSYDHRRQDDPSTHSPSLPLHPLPSTSPAHRDALLDIWHRRLGHMSKETIYKMSRSPLLTGLPRFLPPSSILRCETCDLVKVSRREINPHAHSSAPKVFHTICIDYMGPIDGHYYFQCIDVHSKLKMGRSVRTRAVSDQNLAWIFDIIDGFRNQYTHLSPVVFVKCDNEFAANAKVIDLCRQRGVTLKPTAADSSFSNGSVERLNLTSLNMAKCMLLEAGMTISQLPHAYQTALHILNRTFSATATGYVVPYAILTGKSVDISHFRVFGSKVVYRVPDTQRSKADLRGKLGTFLAYTLSPESFKIRDNGTSAYRVTRDLHFHEFDENYRNSITSTSPRNSTESSQSTGHSQGTNRYSSLDLSDSDSEDTDAATPSDSISTSVSHSSPVIASPPVSTAGGPTDPTPQTPSLTQLPEEPPVSSRLRSSGDAHSLDTDIFLAHVTTDAQDQPSSFIFSLPATPVPSNYDEVLSSQDRSQWQDAIRAEYLSLINIGVFGIPCPLSAGRKATGNKLVLRNKLDFTGQLERRKARLTAQGFSQIPGIDYGITATYAPVAHMNSLRVFLSLVAAFNLECIHVDFVTAFLNSDLEETLYLRPPPGFNDVQDRLHVPVGHVLPLKKAIYGLKQSNYLWNVNVVRTITQTAGFTQLVSDKSHFVRWINSSPQFILLYVDDCVIAADCSESLQLIYELLNSDYQCNNLGDVHWLLGFQISRDKAARTISINQTQFISDMVARFAPSGSPSHLTPADLRSSTTEADSAISPEDIHSMAAVPYRSLIGCLLWVLVISRPDIGPSLLHLCRFQNTPGPKHWQALLWLLGYVSATRSLSLRLGGIPSSDLRLIAWTDANYSKIDDCKSTSGFIICFGGFGSICWLSKRQPLTALSSTEAEYLALAAATKKIIWLRMLLGELHVPPDPSGDPVVIFCDNSSTIQLSKHDVAFNRTQHINIRYHFLRDHVLLKEITVRKIHTSENRADQMTKFSQPVSLFTAQRAINLGLP